MSLLRVLLKYTLSLSMPFKYNRKGVFISIIWNIIVLISVASVIALITSNGSATLKRTEVPSTSGSIFILVYE